MSTSPGEPFQDAIAAETVAEDAAADDKTAEPDIALARPGRHARRSGRDCNDSTFDDENRRSVDDAPQPDGSESAVAKAPAE